MAEQGMRVMATQPGGVEVLQLEQFELPTPSTGEVLLRQTAVGVNFVDIYFRSGLYGWPVEKNLVLGSEAAGVVLAVGEGVAEFQVGDRVAYTVANGAYATHRLVAAKQLVAVPDGVDDRVAAAAILKGLTTHYLVNHSYPVQAGDVVLFHAAAGGVGLIAGQWLKLKGATVIGTAGSDEKCALAQQYGFDQMINYRTEDFVARVREITGGAGVDVVYDSVGKDTYPGSLHCLKTFGSLVNFGQSSGPALDFKLSDLATGSFSVSRPILFHFTADRNWLVQAAADLFGLIAAGKLKININQTFPLAEAAKAHELLAGRQTTGCTVLLL